MSGAVVACPKCDTRLSFSRSATALIDSCGFESYSLECKGCGTLLGGIIDPNGDQLLVSEIKG